ncbi:MAG: hypothetical protein HY981_01410 [Candidatus Magasanikbacteria bacterium]|nr:hypothetical protein [Candidatus Magasanikbacteria bacterium]
MLERPKGLPQIADYSEPLEQAKEVEMLLRENADALYQAREALLRIRTEVKNLTDQNDKANAEKIALFREHVQLLISHIQIFTERRRYLMTVLRSLQMQDRELTDMALEHEEDESN